MVVHVLNVAMVWVDHHHVDVMLDIMKNLEIIKIVGSVLTPVKLVLDQLPLVYLVKLQ